MRVRITKVADVLATNPDEWLANMFGSLNGSEKLRTKFFPHIAEWPEIDPTQKLEIVQFEGEVLRGFAEVDRRLSEEGYDPERRTVLPHLAQILPKIDSIWGMYHSAKMANRIFPSSGSNSMGPGVFVEADQVNFPGIELKPLYRGIILVDINENEFFGDSSGFLVFAP